MKDTIVEQQIKISKLERQGASGLSDLPKAATPAETAGTREFDNPEGRNTVNVSVKSATRLENKCLVDAAQGSPLVEPTPLALSPGLTPEALPNTRSEEPKEVMDEIPVTPHPHPVPPLHESTFLLLLSRKNRITYGSVRSLKLLCPFPLPARMVVIGGIPGTFQEIPSVYGTTNRISGRISSMGSGVPTHLGGTTQLSRT